MLGDIGRLVQSDYKEYVQLAQINEDMKRALLKQDRVPVFLNNMVREMSKMKNLNRETIKMVTYDMTECFIRSFERLATERMMSDLERITKQKEIDKVMEFDKEATEMAKQMTTVTK